MHSTFHGQHRMDIWPTPFAFDDPPPFRHLHYRTGLVFARDGTVARTRTGVNNDLAVVFVHREFYGHFNSIPDSRIRASLTRPRIRWSCTDWRSVWNLSYRRNDSSISRMWAR